jgi:hypothetical protein
MSTTDEHTPAEHPAYEPWLTAVAAVMRGFTIYALERQISSDLDECRREAGVGAVTGELFEDALDAIAEDADDDTETDATPGPGQGQGVAEPAPTQ